MSTREEILAQVEKDAQLNENFILLVVLSAIVAAIGLLENNLAVIVGAMVIAPLLGPNIAFSLGASLGEKKLVFDSLKTLFVGIAILFSIGLGLIWPGSFDSSELMSRTDVAYSGTAVALMPPAVTIGLMLSIGETSHVLGAALLLAVNMYASTCRPNWCFYFAASNHEPGLKRIKPNSHGCSTSASGFLCWRYWSG